MTSSDSVRLLGSADQPLVTSKMSVEMPMTGREEKPMRSDKSRGCATVVAQWVKTAIPQCFFLRRRFFVGMALIFLTFIATLEALNASSNQNNGFVTAVESQALLWQYGPVFGRFLAREGLFSPC